MHPTAQQGTDRSGYMLMRDPRPPYVNNETARQLEAPVQGAGLQPGGVPCPPPLPPPRPESEGPPSEQAPVPASCPTSPTPSRTSLVEQTNLPTRKSPQKRFSKFQFLQIVLILGLYILQIFLNVYLAQPCKCPSVDGVEKPSPNKSLTPVATTEASYTSLMPTEASNTSTMTTNENRQPNGTSRSPSGTSRSSCEVLFALFSQQTISQVRHDLRILSRRGPCCADNNFSWCLRYQGKYLSAYICIKKCYVLCR